MTGQHANVKGAALTLTTLMARLLVEARAELAAQRRPDGRHSVRRAPRGPTGPA